MVPSVSCFHVTKIWPVFESMMEAYFQNAQKELFIRIESGCSNPEPLNRKKQHYDTFSLHPLSSDQMKAHWGPVRGQLAAGRVTGRKRYYVRLANETAAAIGCWPVMSLLSSDWTINTFQTLSMSPPPHTHTHSGGHTSVCSQFVHSSVLHQKTT